MCAAYLAAIVISGVAGEAAAEANPGRLEIQPSQDRLTIRARQVTIGEILTALRRHVALEVTQYQILDEPVTLTIEALPLERALQRLLKHRNFLLQHRPAKTSSTIAQPSRLWIYPRGATMPGGTPAPRMQHHDNGGPADQTGGAGSGWSAPSRDNLTHGDATVRADAVSELTELDDQQAVAELATAVADEDATVRENAVLILGAMEGQLADQLLVRAQRDANVLVREAALEMLVARGGERAIQALDVALEDPALAVRVAAVYTLADLSSAAAAIRLQRALSDPEPAIREAAKAATPQPVIPENAAIQQARDRSH